MHAVLIYDRLDFAARAKVLLERVAQQTGGADSWKVQPWRVDILKLPPVAEDALAEAMAANVILLALHQIQSPSPWLVDWLERWAANRQFQDAALAIWDCGNTETRSVRAIPVLLELAKRHGLNLVFDDNIMGDNESPADAKPGKRLKTITARSTTALPQPL
jgi:hypothetical protein